MQHNERENWTASLREVAVCEVRVGYRLGLGLGLTLLGGAAALAGWLVRRAGALCSSAGVLGSERSTHTSFKWTAAALGCRLD